MEPIAATSARPTQTASRIMFAKTPNVHERQPVTSSLPRRKQPAATAETASKPLRSNAPLLSQVQSQVQSPALKLHLKPHQPNDEYERRWYDCTSSWTPAHGRLASGSRGEYSVHGSCHSARWRKLHPIQHSREGSSHRQNPLHWSGSRRSLSFGDPKARLLSRATKPENNRRTTKNLAGYVVPQTSGWCQNGTTAAPRRINSSNPSKTDRTATSAPHPSSSAPCG